MKLTKPDKIILNALQKDARIGLEKLAHKASLSVASIQRRLKTLRDKRVITKEVAVLNPIAVGQLMSFVVLVELEREHRSQVDAFVKRIQKEPQVQQCYYVTGEADFCLICTAKDMDDFEKMTQRLFFDDTNVRRFRTSVVMNRNKVSMEVFLDETTE